MSMLTEFLGKENLVEDLPLFQELAINFETGEILESVSKDIKILTGTEAVLVWVWKALKTESSRYKAYTEKFGSLINKEIGYVFDREVKTQLIYSMIEDCLLYNPYITRVYNFSSEFIDDTLSLNISFQLDTVYGIIDKKEVDKLNVKTSL
ncbi:MAG: DUF2634 domain-containing protein [Fusobacteriaceae bacterium]